ncbi:MAG: porin [Hyphomicrobiaceae bacterium]
MRDLEASVVRKANRRLSLTVNGQANHVVYGFDDGGESNTYVGTNIHTGSRIRFFGKAQITPDWSAGYRLSVNIWPGESLAQNQNDPNAEFLGPLNLRRSHWYIDSKNYGRLSMGLLGTATDNFISATTSGVVAATFSNILVGSSLAYRRKDNADLTGITTFSVTPFLDTLRSDTIVYATPSYRGLSLRVGFAEDDFWDMAAYYSATLGAFDVRARLGYVNDRDGDYGTPTSPNTSDIKALFSARHNPTGLFAEAVHVHRNFDTPDGAPVAPDYDYTYARAGVFKRFNAYGKTSLFGEVAQSKGALVGNNSSPLNARRGLGQTNDITKADFKRWGFGVMQYIERASTEMYIGYHNFNLDLATTREAIATDDIDVIYAGTIVRF